MCPDREIPSSVEITLRWGAFKNGLGKFWWDGGGGEYGEVSRGAILAANEDGTWVLVIRDNPDERFQKWSLSALRLEWGGSGIKLPVKIAVIDKEGCELRSSASLDAYFIEMVPYNAECRVLERQKGWFKIEAPSGNVGWLSGYGEATGNVYVREVH